MASVVPGDDPRGALIAALETGDRAGARALLERHGELRALLDRPAPELAFGALPLFPLVKRRDRTMIELLLEFGADINARSDWWAGSFGVLDSCDADFAPYLIERGAVVDAHAAARLGMLDRLRELLDRDPALVHARGGDGQTPLHFAANVEVATFLLDRGADIDALDVDHESTPAQWMVRERQDVARFLVARGCRVDLLMAVALGDVERVRRLLDADPASVRTAVNERCFPKRNPRAGGTIYIWTLGSNKSGHAVAREFGHEAILRLLMERSPAPLKLAAAFEIGDERLVQSLLADDPNLVGSLADEDRPRLTDAAQDNRTDAVRLMLAAGWPVDSCGQHGGTPLHWAAWHGNVEMAREILRHAPPLETRDRDFGGTPLGWAIHASKHGWHPDRGDYAGTVETLLHAGAKPPEDRAHWEGSEAVRAVLERHARGD
jgi:ankyrin repeat protein